jgi:hypothetical protein
LKLSRQIPALLEKQVTAQISLQLTGGVERPAALEALSNRGIQIKAVGGFEVTRGLKAVLFSVSFENWHNNIKIIASQFLGNCKFVQKQPVPGRPRGPRQHSLPPMFGIDHQSTGY